MNRRKFIANSVAAASFLTIKESWAASPAHKLDRIGVQLYSVRDAMKSDFEGTIAKVAAIGYREVEFAGYFDRSLKDVRATLERNHLTAPSSHVSYEQVEKKWPETLEAAHAIGHSYVVCPSIPESQRKDSSGWKQAAELFNRAGEASQKAGIQFGYHNHTFEFDRAKSVDGKLPYDFLLAETDPKLVKMEMDLCWITAGGQNPLPYFNRYPGRFPLVHVKDWTKDGHMADVGKGDIDWKRIFAKSGEAGITHYFVEHDEPKLPFDSIRTSYNFLRRLRF